MTGEYMFTKHSVLDRGPAGLLDITPLSDRTDSDFLIHDGSQEEFDTLPNQEVAVDVWRPGSYEEGHARFAYSLRELYNDHLIGLELAAGGDGAMTVQTGSESN